MKTISHTMRCTIGVCAVAALLAGCGGSPQQSALPEAIQNRSTAPRPDQGGSWMAAEAKHDDLVYVSNAPNNTVSVYAFFGHKLIGTLTGINAPYGLCADQSGDVWIVGWGKNQLVEYAHAGTTPLRSLTVSDPQANLYDCSVDPTTGNLAVTDWGYNSFKGYVLIYPHATGTPKAYTGPGVWFYYGCSYDDQGNLFVDGWDSYLNYYLALGELPKGGRSFRNITLVPEVFPPVIGGVQWDGRYVAIVDVETVRAYSVKGQYATLQGTTPLTNHWPVGLFWLTTLANGEREIIAPDKDGEPSAVQYWKYPAGGSPTATITNGLDGPFGVTVSRAKR
jgi:hypothetical protein